MLECEFHPKLSHEAPARSIGAIKGIMEKKMETILVYWGHIGIMEKKGNYYSILGLYRV